MKELKSGPTILIRDKIRDPYSIVGTLPDWAIKAHIADGVIKIDPLPKDWEKKIDPVSIDFHLGNKLRWFKNDGNYDIDTRFSDKEEIEAMMEYKQLKEGQPFILTRDDFVIATTLERLTLPDNIVGRLEGKSSRARLGIVVHSTAARFDPGWDGNPVLEIGTFLANKRILLYYKDPICAFSFERLAASVDNPYMSKPSRSYGGTDIPEVSKLRYNQT